MKRLLNKIFCVLMTACLLSTFASAAVSRASDYLDDYTATLTALGNGRIAVTVDVSGTGPMTEIGASKIYMYESTNNTDFYQVATYTSDEYPEMLTSGSYYFDDAIIHNGVAGRYYIASVYFYAANNTGSDTGHYTTRSCRAT